MKKLFTLLTMLIVAISTSWAGVTIFTSVSQETTDGNWTLVGSNANASSQSSVVFPTPAAETGFPTGTQSQTNYYCKVSGTSDLGAKLTSAKCVTIAGLSSGDQIVVYWFATNTTSTTINLSYATSATKTGTLLQGINTSSVTSKNVYSTTFTALSDGDINKIENGYEGSAGLAYVSSNNSVYIYAIKITASTPATKHSVAYNLGDGTSATGAPTQADVAEGAKFTVASAPTDLVPPTGKEFKCWNDGTNDYNAGAEYTMGESDVEFTAVYQNETVKYAVEYALNGGTGTAPTQASVAEGTVFTVASAEGITAPEGKVFKCWNDGTNDYNAGADYTMGKAPVTLTAQWLTSSDATFSNGQYVIGGSALDLSTLFTSSSDGAVTYTVKSAGNTGAAIAGTSFTATAAGTATVTATQAATATYAGATHDATITVGRTTGANNIEWKLSPINSTSATLTSTQTSTSLYLKNLTTINHSLVGLASSTTKASDRTAKVNRLEGKDDSKYVYVTFDVEDGYTFVPSSITIKVANVSNVTTFDAELVGENGESVGETGKTFASTDGTVETWEITPTVEKSLTGTVTLKIYAYAGTTGTFRFGQTITIAGAVLPEPMNLPLNDGGNKFTKGFTTFCSPVNFTVSEGATAYKAAIADSKLTMTALEGIIPANEGVVIAGNKNGNATITATTDDATADVEGNDLKGTTVAAKTADLKGTATKFLAFKKTTSTFTPYGGENFPANKAYLLINTNNTESLEMVFEEATGINVVNAAETEAQAAPVKVIKNGKLYIGNYNVAGQQVK